MLASGGRVAILTFHSGEDRLVKKSFKRFLKEGEYAEVSKDVIRPSQGECVKNPRARSTKMRWRSKHKTKEDKGEKMDYILLLLGFLLLIKGADAFVDGSSSVAKILKIPTIIIGLTVVAFWDKYAGAFCQSDGGDEGKQ